MVRKRLDALDFGVNKRYRKKERKDVFNTSLYICKFKLRLREFFKHPEEEGLTNHV